MPPRQSPAGIEVTRRVLSHKDLRTIPDQACPERLSRTFRSAALQLVCHSSLCTGSAKLYAEREEEIWRAAVTAGWGHVIDLRDVYLPRCSVLTCIGVKHRILDGTRMSGADWYLLTWKRTFDISSRSQRKEYAYFFVVTAIVGFALLCLGTAFGADETQTITPTRVLIGLYFAAVMVPRTSLMIRRLHDLEITGWLALLGFVPCAGLALDVFCLAADTNPRPNKWGVSPKYQDAQRWMAFTQGNGADYQR